MQITSQTEKEREPVLLPRCIFSFSSFSWRQCGMQVRSSALTFDLSTSSCSRKALPGKSPKQSSSQAMVSNPLKTPSLRSSPPNGPRSGAAGTSRSAAKSMAERGQRASTSGSNILCLRSQLWHWGAAILPPASSNHSSSEFPSLVLSLSPALIWDASQPHCHSAQSNLRQRHQSRVAVEKKPGVGSGSVAGRGCSTCWSQHAVLVAVEWSAWWKVAGSSSGGSSLRRKVSLKASETTASGKGGQDRAWPAPNGASVKRAIPRDVSCNREASGTLIKRLEKWSIVLVAEALPIREGGDCWWMCVFFFF